MHILRYTELRPFKQAIFFDLNHYNRITLLAGVGHNFKYLLVYVHVLSLSVF